MTEITDVEAMQAHIAQLVRDWDDANLQIEEQRQRAEAAESEIKRLRSELAKALNEKHNLKIKQTDIVAESAAREIEILEQQYRVRVDRAEGALAVMKTEIDENRDLLITIERGREKVERELLRVQAERDVVDHERTEAHAFLTGKFEIGFAMTHPDGAPHTELGKAAMKILADLREAQRDLRRAQAQAAAMRKVLSDIDFIDNGDWYYCPSCQNSLNQGHSADCELAAACADNAGSALLATLDACVTTLEHLRVWVKNDELESTLAHLKKMGLDK